MTQAKPTLTKARVPTASTGSYVVPYADLGKEAAALKQPLLEAFASVLESGRYILGPEVSAFEEEFAALCQTGFAVAVGSGTAALQLTLLALGIGPGDEVITAPNSFIATAAAIALTGARPVFADIGPDLNLDPSKVEVAVTSRTRALLPVHLTGRPAAMSHLEELARKHGLRIIEDAAQAVGARLAGRSVGSWGNAACFSLHPLKNLHAYGDGGVITTSDPELRDRLRRLRNHGLRDRAGCEEWGCNSRLDEVQAAMLRVQLRHLERQTEQRRRLAYRYNRLLRPYVEVPEEGPGQFCVYQTYVVQAPRRDELQRHLQEKGIEALVHYPTPIHCQPAARALGYAPHDFPRTMQAAACILSLPLYPGLTNEQQDHVVRAIAEFYECPRRA